MQQDSQFTSDISRRFEAMGTQMERWAQQQVTLCFTKNKGSLDGFASCYSDTKSKIDANINKLESYMIFASAQYDSCLQSGSKDCDEQARKTAEDIEKRLFK